MKVLWISDSPDVPTGLAMVTRVVTAYLARRGYQVDIAGWQTTGEPRPWEGCTLHPLGYGHFGEMLIPGYLRDLRPDRVVTLGDPWWLGFMRQPQVQSWLRWRGALWILYYPLDGALPNGRIPDDWIATIDAADIPVAYSRYGVVLSERCGLRPRYIPHGADTRLFRPPADKTTTKQALGYQDQFVILSDARNQPRKMLPRLLLIFARFAQSKKDVRLHLHCDPDDPAAQAGGYDLRQLIAELDIRDKVVFTEGFTIAQGIPLGQLAQIYQAADVHLLTSGGEGFGLPTLQAAAAGVIPFAPDYSANTELIRGHGELVCVAAFQTGPFGIQRALIDVDECVNRLEMYYRDRTLLRTRGEQARRFALDYDWERILPMWDQLLQGEAPTPVKWIPGERVTVYDRQVTGPVTFTEQVRSALTHLPPGVTVDLEVAHAPAPTWVPAKKARPEPRVCFISQLQDDRSPWTVPTNECRAWAYVLEGDTRSSQRILAYPAQLQAHDIALVELTANLYSLPPFIKRHAPDLTVVGLIEGAVQAVTNQDPSLQTQFVRCVQAVDLLGVLVEDALPYYRLFVDDPQRVQWLGIPYPKAWTDGLPKRPPAAKERLIELGAGLAPGRNGITSLLLFQRLQRAYPGVRGRVYVTSRAEMEEIEQLGLPVECCAHRPWPEYYVHHLDAYAVLSLDPRRTWGRLVLDCASALIPYVGSAESHCGRTVGALTCDPYDVEAAHAHLCTLLEDHDIYERVVQQQYQRLSQFNEAASEQRFWDALAAGGLA
ncbi:MAG: glycosyltransferase family 4 protein [Anaerolineae bacterium]|nr:MAG: glycosyltransferase family 4 protein [Anaerolineae bacterium]